MRETKRRFNATNPQPEPFQFEADDVPSLIKHSNFPAVIRYAHQHQPTATDRFWLACAHDRLGHPLPAIEHLTRAKLEGFETAAAMLGLLYQKHQETKAARITLEAIKFDQLDTTGQMLYHQLRAALAHQNNDHEQASEAILLAQPHALEPCHRIFRPRLAKLALLIAAQTPGSDQHWMLEVLDHLDPTNPQITATSPEQHDQLAPVLETTKLEPLNHILKAHIHLIRAHHRHSQQRHDESIKDLEHVIALTVGHRQIELQVHSQLGFARVFMHPSYPINRTREHLEQAQHLARNNDGLQAQVQLGLARWHTHNHHQDVFDTLQAAQTAALNLQHRHDNAINYLHLCEAMLQYDQPEKANRALEAARRILGRMDQANIELELEHLPLTRSKLLSTRPRHIDPTDTGEVLLKTLGTAQIQHNARHVKLNIGLSRTLAILTYLLEHPNADLSEIQLAVFEGTNSQFRSYLHQSRYELQRHIPGLSLPYDRDSRTYSIATNLHLRWDAQELLRALRELNHGDLLEKLEDYKGPFLNTLDTPWTEEVRNTIEAQLTRQGLSVLKQLHAKGQHDLCLQLAERLLKINPFLPEVIEVQIQVTSERDGKEAGKRLQTDIIRQLKVHFGGIPEDFQAILQTTTP